jgi:hypothetical protein
MTPARRPRRLLPALAGVAEALASGRATGRALWRIGVHVDLAPLLGAADGPFGSRHFRRPAYALAFARGLGSAAVSADDRPHVRARLRG